MYTRIAVILVLLLAAASCGGSDSISDRAAEQIAEQIAEQQGVENVDINTDDGVVSIEDEEGNFATIGGGDLPDGFPFPTPGDFEVLTTLTTGSGGETQYNAVLSVPADDVDDVYAMYQSFLEDEGFEVSTSEFSSDGSQLRSLSGARDDVSAVVSISVDGDEATVNLIWGNA